MSTWVAGLSLLTCLGLASSGCSTRSPISLAAEAASPLPATDAGASTSFVQESFDQLYPVFLLRKLASGPKANLWRTQYEGKWVRWTGHLVSVTPNGITLRQLGASVTFDVSLQLEPAAKAKLRHLHPNSKLTYVGRLTQYDDVFRTFYLDHGDIAPEPDR